MKKLAKNERKNIIKKTFMKTGHIENINIMKEKNE